MDRKALRLVQAIADAGHFGRAADRLGVAQPHLSSSLKALEARLGLRLFDRRPVVRLTPQGEMVLRALQRTAGEFDQTVRQARLVQAGAAGALSIGFASSVMLTELGRVIGDFRDARPDIQLALLDMHSAPQWEALQSRRIDVALTREIRAAADIDCRLVLRDPLALVAPARHRLARTGSGALAMAAGEPFVLFPQGKAPMLHAEIVAACAAAGFAPEVAQEAGDWPTILALVSYGFGVTLAPGCLRAMNFPGVVFRHLEPGTAAASVFLCHPSQALSPAARSFVDFVAAAMDPGEAQKG